MPRNVDRAPLWLKRNREHSSAKIIQPTINSMPSSVYQIRKLLLITSIQSLLPRAMKIENLTQNSSVSHFKVSRAVGSSLNDPRMQSAVHRNRVPGIVVWVTLSSSGIPSGSSRFDLSVKISCIGKHAETSQNGYRQCELLERSKLSDRAGAWYIRFPPDFLQDNLSIFIIWIRNEIFYEITDSVFLWLLVGRLTRKKLKYCMSTSNTKKGRLSDKKYSNLLRSCRHCPCIYCTWHFRRKERHKCRLRHYRRHRSLLPQESSHPEKKIDMWDK